MARMAKRRLNTEGKLPAKLVAEKARVASESYATWRRAKPENDFGAMEPYYRELFDIARETSALLGTGGHVYDPLIDLYEEGATHEVATRMFAEIKQPLVDLVKRIQSDGGAIDDTPLRAEFDAQRLRSVAEELIRVIGFDFSKGRLDLANNAFCTNLGCQDVRLTARPSEHVKGVLSSALHEMGHGLYEQFSPPEFEGTPIQGGISLAVHESQSRLWENIIGRCRAFWQCFFPVLSREFSALQPMGADGFWRAYTRVEPEYIRVGADELTYNLHILIRFELEVEILERTLDVQDLPDAWNAKYTEYLGITPPTNTLGCLQDVHWSKGSIGYFPTYAMGNMIGGQLWRCLLSDIPDADAQMTAGSFAPILDWLTERIYRKASLHSPHELIVGATGRGFGTDDWLSYATTKYQSLYGLN